ncbi:MAG: methionyl-tRNA formyltransferase [Patescibacteria group bacterium]
MSKKYTIIFAGTSEFAVPSLTKLSQADFIDLALVITQPEKPAGRQKELLPSPVKTIAQELNLNLSQPNKIIEIKDQLEKIKPDLGIVVSYGQIIPPAILDLPKLGWLNLHPSLLPKYRGSSPIQNAILNNDSETGISLMLLDSKMDHGPVLVQEKVKLDKKYTAVELTNFLADKAGELLIENLANYLDGKIESQVQDDNLASFTKIITKYDGKIDWQKSATEIECQIRAYFPWPGSFTFWNSKRLKIIASKVAELEIKNKKPGQVFVEENKILIACGQGVLEIEKLQLEGKLEMSAEIFIRGYADLAGQILN